jgi:hypothetical protein
MSRSDEDIRAEVVAELRWDPQLDADHVVVWLLDGVVALTGFVRQPDDLWKATLIAARVGGVRCVMNHLGVSGPPPDARRQVWHDGEALRAQPRPPRRECEDWVQVVHRASPELDAAAILSSLI